MRDAAVLEVVSVAASSSSEFGSNESPSPCLPEDNHGYFRGMQFRSLQNEFLKQL